MRKGEGTGRERKEYKGRGKGGGERKEGGERKGREINEIREGRGGWRKENHKMAEE